jgi:hypothetical protein
VIEEAIGKEEGNTSKVRVSNSNNQSSSGLEEGDDDLFERSRLSHRSGDLAREVGAGIMSRDDTQREQPGEDLGNSTFFDRCLMQVQNMKDTLNNLNERNNT